MPSVPVQQQRQRSFRNLSIWLGALWCLCALVSNYYFVQQPSSPHNGKSVKEQVLADFATTTRRNHRPVVVVGIHKETNGDDIFTKEAAVVPNSKNVRKANGNQKDESSTPHHQNATTDRYHHIDDKKENAPHQVTTTSFQQQQDGNYTCQFGPLANDTLVLPPHTPTFVLIGVQKSGTTALLTYFRDHPNMLQTRKRFRREAHFFDSNFGPLKKVTHRLRLPNHQKWCFYLSHYAKIFPIDELFDASPKPLYTFEKTPSYFSSRDVPYRLKLTCPWCKVILILRNPIDRAFSHFKMTTRDARATQQYTLEDFINHEITRMQQWNMTTAPAMNSTVVGGVVPHYYTHRPIPHRFWTRRLEDSDGLLLDSHMLLRKGLYSHQLEWWLQYFEVGTNMLVVNYQDLLEDTGAVYRRILDFTGIPQDAATTATSNTTFGRVRQSQNTAVMSNSTRRYLQDFFRPYNAQLEDLLGPEWSLDKLQGW